MDIYYYYDDDDEIRDERKMGKDGGSGVFLYLFGYMRGRKGGVGCGGKAGFWAKGLACRLRAGRNTADMRALSLSPPSPFIPIERFTQPETHPTKTE